MNSRWKRGWRFVSGRDDTGRLVLTRQDGSVGRCGVVMIRNAELVDNQDLTFDVVFPGS